MIRLMVLATGIGDCALSGKKNCDGLVVSFEDGTIRESHLSWKGFKQLLSLKAGQAKSQVEAVPLRNGHPVTSDD